jgi:hypothetical protein
MERICSTGPKTATGENYSEKTRPSTTLPHHKCLNWTQVAAARCQLLTARTMAQPKTMILSNCLHKLDLVLHQVLHSCICIVFVTPDCCLIILAATNSIKPNISGPSKATVRCSYIYQAENSCSQELRPWHCSSAVPDGLGTPWPTSLQSLCSYFGSHLQHLHQAAAGTTALCPNATSTSSTSPHLPTINLSVATAIHHYT